MIYKVTYDEEDNPAQAELWMELNKIPPSEIDAHPAGFRLDKYGWIDADNETDALEKAKHIHRL